jgi:16S rRNA (cytosine967-C5)-methyltransferase
MTPGARIQAAIEIIDDLDARRRPADKALREWGTSHRFAGSKDRAAIRDLVFAVFRRRGEAVEAIGSETARALVLGALCVAFGQSDEDIAGMLKGGKYDAAALSPEERAALQAGEPARGAVGGVNWPDWLRERMIAAHGERAEPLMAALQASAPLDLRINVAMTERDKVIEALEAVGFPAKPTPFSPWGVRVARAADLTQANIRSLPLFRSGAIEIQDEGSQLAALLSGAKPGDQIIELCAGGGGKTAALGAMTGRSGQIHACDVDEARLRAGGERVRRAQLHNVQPHHIHAWDPLDGGGDPDLEGFAGKVDLVFLDVPCTGSGAWRRQPDAKWRLTPERLDELCAAQASLLRRGARLTKPGGRMLYVTCSVLAEENAAQIAAFLSANSDWMLADLADAWQAAIGAEPPAETSIAIEGARGHALQLSPVTTHTDGFFIALLERAQ